MQIDYRSADWFITNPVSGNVTASSITLPTPTRTKPTGDGTFEVGGPNGEMSAQKVLLVPYGAGSATNTFTMAVYGWRATTAYGGTYKLWVPTVLASFTCTLCTAAGVAGCDVNASQLFCGTIVLVIGNANISNEVLSPTGNDIGHIVLDTKGCKVMQVLFGTGASATSCNCLATKV